MPLFPSLFPFPKVYTLCHKTKNRNTDIQHNYRSIKGHFKLSYVKHFWIYKIQQHVPACLLLRKKQICRSVEFKQQLSPNSVGLVATE